MISPHVPGGGGEGRQQASGKNSTSLKRGDAENLAGSGGMLDHLVDDVEQLRPDDAAQHDENAEVPGFVAVDAEALGIAHADP